MIIIYLIRNDCLCSLFLITVDTIRGWLPQVTASPFCAGIELGRNTAQSTAFSHPYGKKTIILGTFYGFKGKCLFRINVMRGNSYNISHVAILTWPGMTLSLASHGSVNAITQHFSLNSFLVLSFDAKMSRLKRRWEVLRANQCFGNSPFISINVSFRKTVSLVLKTYPWIFHHPNFIKHTSTFDASKGVNVRFVLRVLKVHPAF